MKAAQRQSEGGSRLRQARRTRAALLAAARAAFSENGYAGASLDDIATRAGFTKGALYGHFASKDDLFLALLAEHAATTTSGWAEALPAGTGIAEIRALSADLAATVHQERDWALATTEFSIHAARHPELAAQRREAIRKAAAELTDTLQRAVGEPIDAAAAAPAVMALVDGMFLMSAIDPDVDLAGALAHGLERLLISVHRGPTSVDTATS